MIVPKTLRMVAQPLTTKTLVTGEVVKLHNTFPVNPDSEKRLKTAQKWAGEKRTEEDVPNEFKGLRIIDLETRMEGGRAYKALLSGKYMVDLREDVLFEIMLKKGIQVGGFVSETFAFALNSTQLKLYWVESAVYKALVVEDQRKSQQVNNGKVHPRDYEFGKVYKDGLNKRLLYLGTVRTAAYEKVTVNQADIDTYYSEQTQRLKEATKKFTDKLQSENKMPKFGGMHSNLANMFAESFGDMWSEDLELDEDDIQGKPGYRRKAPKPVVELRESEKPAKYQIWFCLWAGATELSREKIAKSHYNIYAQKNSTRYPTNDQLTRVPFTSAEEFVEWVRVHKMLDEFGHFAEAEII